MEGFISHDIGLTSDLLIYGLPATFFNNRLARGAKATTSYNSGSTILQLLQLIYFSDASTPLD